MEIVKNVEAEGTLQNLVRQLKFFNKKNNTSPHQLSKMVGISNGSMYNILDASNYPAINTITKLCHILNCTVAEILGSDLFLDIPVYSSLDNYAAQQNRSVRRVYFPFKHESILYEDLLILDNIDFIHGRKHSNTQLPGNHGYLIFRYTKDIFSTGGSGQYIANIAGKMTDIKITSLSGDSAKIQIQDDKKETNIDCAKIQLLYKHVAIISLIDYNNEYLRSTSI